MDNTIPVTRIGRLWIVGLAVVGSSLLVSANIAWYWLPLALLVVGAVAWALIGHEAGRRTGGYGSGPDASVDQDSALDTLKQQYAVGKIDEVEFERRLETLLEDEPIIDVENRVDLESEVTNETRRDGRTTERQTSNHGRKCHRRGMGHHGRH